MLITVLWFHAINDENVLHYVTSSSDGMENFHNRNNFMVFDMRFGMTRAD